ncbi:MAG: hypothetical protein O2779_00560 [Nanoarchaeota archaeon]|nr:hypothetical protein [Nanoarchaeota archaeon]
MGKGFSKDMGKYLGGRKNKAFLKRIVDQAKNKASLILSAVDEKKSNLGRVIKSNIKSKKEELLHKKEDLLKKREITRRESHERKKIELQGKIKLQKERLEQKTANEIEREKLKHERILAKNAVRDERRKLKQELLDQKERAKSFASIPPPPPEQLIKPPTVQEPESEAEGEPEIPAVIPEPTPEPTLEPAPASDPIQQEPPPIPEAIPEPTTQIHPDALNILLETSKQLGQRMEEIATKVDVLSKTEQPLPPLSELPLAPQELPPASGKKSLLKEMFKSKSKPSNTEKAAEDSYQDFAYEAEDDVSYAGNSVSKHEPKQDWQHLQQEEINAIQYAVASGKHKERLNLNTQENKDSDWKEVDPNVLESFDEPQKKKKSKLFGFISVKRVSEIEQEQQQAEIHEEMQATSDYITAQEILNNAVPEEVRYNEPSQEEAFEDPFADLEEPKETKDLNDDNVIVLDDDYKIEVVEHK